MKSSRDWLRQLGVPDDCVAAKTSASEHGRSFAVILPKGLSALRVRVDGCWLRANDRRKTDYMFVADLQPKGCLCLLVEFKGGHYGEALHQIAETLQYFETLPPYRANRPRILVAHAVLSHGNQIPRYQLQESRLRKRYGVEIYRSSRQGEYRANIPV